MTPSFLKSLLAALASLLFTALAAQAVTYPLTVTDLAGRKVEIPAEPQRVALQDGRSLLMLALLDRKEPFNRVKLWNNLFARMDVPGWEIIKGAWPEAENIPNMNFGDNGQVNAEKILAARPQLVIAEARAQSSMEQAGVMSRLEGLKIPVLFVDTFKKPVPNAVESVTLLGKVLNREAEAKDYGDFYNRHLDQLKAGIKAAGTHPKVFVEVLAGKQGVEQCCFTHGTDGWGALVEDIGAQNVGSILLPGAKGDVTLESAIAQKPDVYVLTGRTGGGNAAGMIPFGYGATQAEIQAAMKPFLTRPGFSSVKASRDGRVYGIYHHFYSNVFNIVALEYLARMAYPEQFKDLDPKKTWDDIIARFTNIPPAPILLEAKAENPAG